MKLNLYCVGLIALTGVGVHAQSPAPGGGAGATGTPAAAGAPPAFEVASIKPAAPSQPGRMMIRMGGDAGRVDYGNVSLKDIVTRAYKLQRYQVSGPDWMDSARFDVAAKIPDGVARDQVPAMLQALLAERFRMKVHHETKEQSIFALVVAKGGPKLKTAEEPAVEAPRGPDGTPAANRGRIMMTPGKVEIRRTSMPGFAEFLSNLMDRPVLNETNLDGNFDIDMEISMEEMAGVRRMPLGVPMHGSGGPAGPESGPAPAAAPSGSIFTAIQQVGLKLEARKGPVEFLVVDAAEKVPLEN